MSSIIRVDTLQKPDGSTPTAADLGIDVAGSVVQVQHASLSHNNTPSVTSGSWAYSGFGCQITPKSASNKLLVTVDFTVGTASGGRPYVGIGRDNAAPSDNPPAFIKWETDYSWPAASQHAAVTGLFDASSTTTTTMQVWLANDTGGTTYLNRNGNGQAAGVTTITIYEIAQ